MKRIYRLHGKETSLDALLEYLEDLLQYNGNTEMWEEIGVDFEDVNELGRLMPDEYNVLDKIASRSKMDCWFTIQTDEDGNDYIYDCEEDTELSLEAGILQLNDGITDLDDYELTEEEKSCYLGLIDRIFVFEGGSHEDNK